MKKTVDTVIGIASTKYGFSLYEAMNEKGFITKLGMKMAEFPLEYPSSKILLSSVDLGCSDEILSIIVILHTYNIFHRPREKKS